MKRWKRRYLDVTYPFLILLVVIGRCSRRTIKEKGSHWFRELYLGRKLTYWRVFLLLSIERNMEVEQPLIFTGVAAY